MNQIITSGITNSIFIQLRLGSDRKWKMSFNGSVAFPVLIKRSVPKSGIKKGKNMLAMMKRRSDVTKTPAKLLMVNQAQMLSYYV